MGVEVHPHVTPIVGDRGYLYLGVGDTLAGWGGTIIPGVQGSSMKGRNTSTDGLTTNCPITCPCGGGVDTTAHHSRKEGICVECHGKVSLD